MSIYFFISTLVLTILFPQSANAVVKTSTSTSSAQAKVASVSAQINDTKEVINEDIQKIRDAVKLKVQEKLKIINDDQNPENGNKSKKSIIGTIIQIDKNNITIDNHNNTRQIQISEDTVIINAKKTKVKADALKIGQEIVAMGYMNNSVLDTKRIVFTDLKSLEIKEQVVIGNIVDISKTNPIIVLIPSKNKNTQYQIKTDAKTEIVNKDNKKVDIKSLSNGQKIVVIVKEDSTKKTFTSSKIITLSTPSTPTATPTIKK